MVKGQLTETVCLLIFPLVSLMRNQVSNLHEKGVKAVVLGPQNSDTENKDATDGKFNIVFASPEALFGLRLIGACKKPPLISRKYFLHTIYTLMLSKQGKDRLCWGQIFPIHLRIRNIQ